ncbi:MAG: sodium-dependent transporter [Bacteroidales bacterium]|nr:sodium-dependent transporter [Bacteroidales bacterium]
MASRSSFSGSIGFVLAAAGSAVGLGNIWRFPYLAAKDGGGLFLLVYLILAVTFGFTLLTTEIAIGRRTKRSPLSAYRRLHPRFKFLGSLACLIPMMILPYYCAIGGWVMKYTVAYLTGNGAAAAEDGYFTGFITSEYEPIVYTLLFLLATSYIIFRGVNKGIETSSKILMPILLLLIIGVAIFSLTIQHTDAEGVTRTGLDGLKIFIIPDFSGLTFDKLSITIMDAIGQLFFSLSIAMGIMVSYGSYVKPEENLIKSINKIEIFDTLVAFIAGVMIIPVVFVFMGQEGMSQSGPGLMFVNIPKIFATMGTFGYILGAVFFTMVLFAALTSAMSMMESIVSSFIDKFGYSRKKSTVIEFAICAIAGILVCLGYNLLYFELPLPNGVTAQILDLVDYISNNLFMPLLAIITCVLVGWIVKPQKIIDEITLNGEPFTRRGLYVVMVKYIAPILLMLLLIKSVGIL